MLKAGLDEAGVVSNDERAAYLAVAVKGQGVDVEGRAANDREIADAPVDLRGAGGLGGASGKSGGKTGGDRDGLPVGVIDGDPNEVLPLTVSLDNVIQGAVVGAAGGRLEAFLKIFGKNRRAMQEVIAKITTFGAHLIDGVHGRNAEHAYGEGEDEFKSCTHKILRLRVAKTRPRRFHFR